MNFLKRILLFFLVNLAVIALLMTIMSIFHLEPYITPYGLNLSSLAVFSAVIGFAGALISLALSKWIVKKTLKIRIVKNPQNSAETHLTHVISQIASQAGVRTPEIGIYQSREINAFATGPTQNRALVAVSSTLLEQFSPDELEGVLAHEMTHVTNGDMITMTLLQGVLNTFVIFLARAGAYAIQSATGRDEIGELAYWGLSIFLEIIFGVFAMMILMAFSRRREFRADIGGARFSSKRKMISALQKLQKMQNFSRDPKQSTSLHALKISDRQRKRFRFFASHPPLAERIARLEAEPIG
ncbi:protease HtpX [bacterium]|jgi:heat shock protein HtpX|nr:protease HtpX [bacterium]MBT6832336.1 protease HtpX [bacterium]MBT6996431.1 protease HtpX [bacterium]MBT7772742.1 protease HtpX [bacterium]